VKIFVDADSCAKKARKFLLKISQKNQIPLVLAANREIVAGSENPFCKMEICGGEKDAADDFIFENSAEGDVAVTRDLVLAQRLLQKKVFVMNDLGTIFTKKNITQFLEERELSLRMKNLGVSTGGKQKSYGKEEFALFAENAHKIIFAQKNLIKKI
jgi:uncharacterized protein YaiI (UPF0178 family)